MKFYYLNIFLLLIIFLSNTYNKKNETKIFLIKKKNNIEIINHTSRDYLSWKEGKKIKKINIPLSINTFSNKNSLKKNYELLSFYNIINSFNQKKYYNNISLIPNLFFTDKNYISKKEISYFNVKTPTTQLFYENNFNEQLLETVFTQSPQKNINYSIHYKYLYPKIKYKNKLLSINYFLTTFNYNDIKNKHYKIWIHFINHYINNGENSYLKNIFLINNIRNTKRLYIGQYMKLYNNIYLINRLEYEKKNYIYKEKKYDNIFGNVYINEPRINKKYYNKISNEFSSKYFFNKKKFFLYGIGYYKLNYYQNNKISNKINNNIFSFFINIISQLNNKININFFGKYLLYNNNYNINTYYTFFKIKYNISFNSKIEGRLLFYNISPSFNMILNSSFYKQNNYINNFINITNNQFYFNFINKNINISFNIYNINNYIFFSSKNNPKQNKNILKIFNFYFYKKFNFKKIKYNLFFKIQNNNSKLRIFNYPNLIIKNIIFYENIIFNKKILFQSGIIFKYFNKYLLNNNKSQILYNRYYLSNKNIMEGLPFLDYFINIEFFRIKIYFIIENINLFNKEKLLYNNEFLIKFGLLWNMFT